MKVVGYWIFAERGHFSDYFVKKNLSKIAIRRGFIANLYEDTSHSI